MAAIADWLALTVSPWELIARGSIMYVGLVLTVRFLLRRDVASASMADVLFIVLIADAAQNAMSGEYRSISDGAVLIATLVGWNLLLDWVSYRSPALRRLVEAPPLPLIEDGKWVRKNLRQEWISPDEVLSKLRESGIEDIAEVRRAYLEPSGELGIIRRRGSEAPGRSGRRRQSRRAASE